MRRFGQFKAYEVVRMESFGWVVDIDDGSIEY